MKAKPEPKKKSRRWPWISVSVVMILVIIYGFLVNSVSLPVIHPSSYTSNLSASSPAGVLAWPSYGQSAIGVNKLGVLVTNGTQKPAPIASTAKLVTALSVLSKYPLAPNEQGPTITLTQADVNSYGKYLAEGGSVVAVVAGEKITEYQMLEAMLLPSANNMADSIATWAFGSLPAYESYANNYLKTLNLNSTHIGIDASGFDPSTTSTASDLVNLGEIVMSNNVLAHIVGQLTASGIPVAGNIKNVNNLLGQIGIVGVKTGNTAQAGGVFLSASNITVNGRTQTLVTAVMGGPTLWQAMDGSFNLVKSAQANFVEPTSLAAITKGTIVGQYIVPWNKRVISAVADEPLNLTTWKGEEVNASLKLQSISFKSRTGNNVGQIIAQDNLFKDKAVVGVSISSAPDKPSYWWLAVHPNYVL